MPALNAPSAPATPGCTQPTHQRHISSQPPHDPGDTTQTQPAPAPLPLPFTHSDVLLSEVNTMGCHNRAYGLLGAPRPSRTAPRAAGRTWGCSSHHLRRDAHQSTGGGPPTPPDLRGGAGPPEKQLKQHPPFRAIWEAGGFALAGWSADWPDPRSVVISGRGIQHCSFESERPQETPQTRPPCLTHHHHTATGSSPCGALRAPHCRPGWCACGVFTGGTTARYIPLCPEWPQQPELIG